MKTVVLTAVALFLSVAFSIAGGVHLVSAQGEATPTPASEEEVTPEPSFAEQLAQLAQVNPPPRFSDLPVGVTNVPCDPIVALSGEDEVEGETYYCGVFTVPQNWDAPDGRNLDLTFVVAKATGDAPAPDPLLFLAGGPGQSAVLTGIDAYANVRPTRDIVRLAQRGSGLGQRLGEEECLALAGQDEAIAARLEALIDAAQAAATSESPVAAAGGSLDSLCWELFAGQGLDLDQFTTAASARDVVELVKALGYDTYNLHGISYGTRLAMTIMAGVSGVEDAPALRSVVLDSTVPPSIYLLSSLPPTSQNPVLQVLTDCDDDAVCSQTYPDLERRLRLLLDRLAVEQLAVDDETVTPDALVATLEDLSGTRSAYIPKLIAELEAGVLDTYLALRDRTVGLIDPETTGGLDLSDPLQAFISQMLEVAVGIGGMDKMFEVVAVMGIAMSSDDPMAVFQEYIDSAYAGDARDELQAALAALTPEQVAASPLVIDARNRAGEEEPTPEELDARAEVQSRRLSLIGVAHYLNQNIHCNEDYQFERVEDAVNAYNDLPFPELVDMAFARDQASSCDDWPVAAAPIEVKNPVSSTVPALILQGAYDQATPVYFGRRAARELANSTLVLIPQQGHEVWKNATACAGQIATAFVLDPAQELALACLDVRRPQWAMAEE